MPFLSLWGGYEIIDDIVKTKKNPETGEIIQQGNGYAGLEVSVGRKCSYDPTHDNFKEVVWRGTPQPKKVGEPGGMNWLDTPVWRAVTNRYNEIHWDRFIKHYIKHVDNSLNPNSDRLLWYEPDFVDVEIRDYDAIPLHMPTYILDKIVKEKLLFGGTKTIFEEALTNSKVGKPGVPMMVEAQVERFIKAIEYRKKQEAKDKELDSATETTKKPVSATK